MLLLEWKQIIDNFYLKPRNNLLTCFQQGFTPDVKVWEVVFDKSSNFKEVKRAFELKGHGAAVYSFDFNNDSRR